MTSALKGRHRWLTNLSTVAVLLGLFIAAAYVWLAIGIPVGSRLSLAVILGLVTGFANLVGDRIEQRGLRALRELGEGTGAPTQSQLLNAALEVTRQPELSFWLSLGFVTLGSLMTGGLWWWWSGVPPEVAVRVGLIGLMVAPLTGTLALLASIPRGRQLLGEIVAAGLPLTALYEGVPVTFGLRRRLMLFAAAAVFTPLALVADLALRRLHALLELLVVAQDPEEMRLLGEAQRSEGLAPLIGLVVLVVMVVSVSAWLSGSILGEPLRELAAQTQRLARGEHGQSGFVAGEHETFAAAAAIAGMEAQLVGLLGGLRHAAADLSGATGVLSEGNAGAASPPRLAVQAAAATTGELARSAREIAGNAQQVSALAGQTLEAARGGRDGSDSFMAAMVQVREGNQAIADSVVRLNKRVQQVGRIIEFINGIADKSDLLALNAELEGNKAGEVGRGFSLVAAEMRRLAESVMQSTREIGGLIDEIRDATNAAVMATEAGVKATEAGAGLAQKVGEGLSRIVDYANQSADALQSISRATAQQEAGTDQLAEAMGDIVESTEASGAAAKEMVTAHDELISLALDLEQTVDRFEVHS